MQTYKYIKLRSTFKTKINAWKDFKIFYRILMEFILFFFIKFSSKWKNNFVNYFWINLLSQSTKGFIRTNLFNRDSVCSHTSWLRVYEGRGLNLAVRILKRVILMSVDFPSKTFTPDRQPWPNHANIDSCVCKCVCVCACVRACAPPFIYRLTTLYMHNHFFTLIPYKKRSLS